MIRAPIDGYFISVTVQYIANALLILGASLLLIATMPTCPHVKAGLSLDELIRIYKSKSAEVSICFIIRCILIALIVFSGVKMIYLYA